MLRHSPFSLPILEAVPVAARWALVLDQPCMLDFSFDVVDR